MRKFVGVLIVFAGGLLGLTALLGFTIDQGVLLSAIQAPVFESSLRVLLDSHSTLFTIASFALVFFILVCSTIAISKGTTHMGFTIMVASLLAGISAWPRGTAFMLIAMFGAHWIAMAEAASDKPASAPQPSTAPRQRAPDGQPASNEADTASPAETSAASKRPSLIARIKKRLFY